MNDQPAILIQFDPQTWKPTAVYFKSSCDRETERLRRILKIGFRTETLIFAAAEGCYNA
jgi:hypothetical protein